MYLNGLVQIEDVIEGLEQLSTVRSYEGEGPFVKYSDVIRSVKETTPAIYKMTAADARKLNEAATGRGTPRNAGTVEVKIEADTEEAQGKIEALSGAIEDLQPRIRVSTIRDCPITINICKDDR